MIDDPRASGDEPSPANDDQTAETAPSAKVEDDGLVPTPSEAPEDEAANLKDQLLRTLAELENTRRRARKEVEDSSKFAISSFARDCLSVADNLERALSSVPQDALSTDERLAALHQGVEMTGRELMTILERYGIKRVEAAGERFDPNLHQAMLEIATDDQPPGTVVQVLQVGYTIAGRLLRPAMVSVAKAGPAGVSGAPEPEGDPATSDDENAPDSRDGQLDTGAR